MGNNLDTTNDTGKFNKRFFKRAVRNYARAAAVALPLSLLVLSFQNCSPKVAQFGQATPTSQLTGSESLGSSDISAISNVNPTPVDPLVSMGTTAAANSASGGTTVAFQVVDNSVSNGSVITRLVQTITGGGSGLRGCTNPIANRATACTKDSDFGLILNAWGVNSFNSAADVYSINLDVSKLGYPHTQYFSRFILANGDRREVTWTPKTQLTTTSSTSTSTTTSNSSTSGLTWVYTNPQFCVGPTPPPVKIGSACSVRGQTATNACGTATCQ